METINIADIQPSSNNHRKTFSDESLAELAESIKTQGVLQPIMVQRISNDKYEIIYGERRYRASLLAEFDTIPAIVRDGLSNSETFEIALTENLQREDISPIEELWVYEQLMEHQGYDIELLMTRFSKSESYIRSRLRLSGLIEEFRKLLRAEDINLVIALELCKYGNEIQVDIHDSHYATTNSYQNWKGKRAKEVVEMLENTYSTNLDDYFFKKSECCDCRFNTDTLSLFGDSDSCGQCLNKTCLQNKNSEYIIERTIETCENNPELPIARANYLYDEVAVEELIAKGYEIEIIESYYECPKPPINPNKDDYETSEEYQEAVGEYEEECAELNSKTTEINERYQTGEIKMYAHIGYRGVSLVYANVSSVNSSVETPLAKLQNKNIRNAEIRDEKIVDDLKILVNGGDPRDGEFTNLEERLTYFTMLKEIRKEHFKLLGVMTDDHYALSSEDKLRIINNLTEDAKTIIRREFILSTFKNAFRNNTDATLLIEYTRERFPEELIEIENKHTEVLEKRQQRISEKIKMINE